MSSDGASRSTSGMHPSPLEAEAASSSSPPFTPLDIGGPVASARFSGGNVFLWDPADIVRLRTRGHVAVTPVGLCSAKVATRGKAAAVPVLLSDEELYVCWRNGWVTHVPSTSSAPVPPTSSSSSSAAAGTKRKAGGGPDSSSSSSPSPSSTGLVDIGAHLAAVAAAERARWGPSGSPTLLRRTVFFDLWRRGYCITNGLKFGVHFLAYRSDPTAVHAAFMVIAAREGEGIAPLDLVARARVATTALKTCVVAWADVGGGGGGGGGSGEASSSSSSSSSSVRPVRYAAFKRMGPGTALFADTAAQEAARGQGYDYFVEVRPHAPATDDWMALAAADLGDAALLVPGGAAAVV
jgi:tRNA splicing endonuclease